MASVACKEVAAPVIDELLVLGGCTSHTQAGSPRVLLRSAALGFDVAYRGVGWSRRWLLFPSLSALRTMFGPLGSTDIGGVRVKRGHKGRG